MRSVTFQGDGIDVSLRGSVGGGDIGQVEPAPVPQCGAHGGQDLCRVAAAVGMLGDRAG